MPRFTKQLLLTLLIAFCNSFLFAQNENDSVPKHSFFVKIFSAYTQNLNYYTITVLMTVESSFIPFPSEIVVPPAIYQACNPENTSLYVTDSKWINIALVIFFATIGALLGAIINYYLALILGRPFIYWFAETRLGKLCLLDAKKVQKAESYFVKNGSISTLIGRFIPAIRQLISIPAGLAKMKMTPFLLYTCLGAGIWNIVLAIIGYFAHGQQEVINQYSNEISYVIVGLAVLFCSYLIYKIFLKKKKSNHSDPFLHHNN
ncbi:MAG: DedA family protein [Bacteroidales bacterium]|jgi:membrane protein DedA with SNARE-associated domain|nr:DedA family protein [Bacteroidales bacterium]